MRIRVPVAVRNRLLRVEARRPVNLPIGGWPPLMELDEWEMLASAMQDELAASAYEETQPVRVPQPVYLPQPVRKSDDGLGEQRPLSGTEAYLAAQQKNRQALTTFKA
ncbi:hypothetical protein H7F36_16125 [Variovorax sp. PAMC28562]|uniref:hypothetical protein n=1 Tax=Variovorax sp. PAMC28562 TaxID=2762323 RepID=UPI00164D3720|nr:hypothetical protein [Variovorax sp. PAMC28562]QNK72707.1 hypothetical protein H7F36_16125 [Variovorax sp. PAMC28562]